MLQAKKPRDLAVVLLLAAAGLRVGEVARLQVGDIELPALAGRPGNERKGALTVRAGKGGRYLKPSAEAAQAQSVWSAREALEKLSVGLGEE